MAARADWVRSHFRFPRAEGRSDHELPCSTFSTVRHRLSSNLPARVFTPFTVELFVVAISGERRKCRLPAGVIAEAPDSLRRTGLPTMYCAIAQHEGKAPPWGLAVSSITHFPQYGLTCVRSVSVALLPVKPSEWHGIEQLDYSESGFLVSGLLN